MNNASPKQVYQLPDLPYDYSALVPVISAEIMEVHYTKHHKTYVANLNAALEKYHEAEICCKYLYINNLMQENERGTSKQVASYEQFPFPLQREWLTIQQFPLNKFSQ